MEQVFSDFLSDCLDVAINTFLTEDDWNNISSALNLVASVTPCSEVLVTVLNSTQNNNGINNNIAGADYTVQQKFHQEMVESIAELKSYMSSLDRKLDKVLQADMEAGLMALQSSTSTEDPALSKSYLSNAISSFMRAISQEQNTRKVQAMFNLGLCQILQGDFKNGWSNLFNAINVPYVESEDETKSQFLENRQNVQNSIATVIQTSIPVNERCKLGAEGMVCSAKELSESIQSAKDGDVIKLFPTQFTLEQPLTINKNISLVPLFPDKSPAIVSDLEEPIIFKVKTAVFEKTAFIRVTDTENSKLPFFKLQNTSPVFKNCTFLTKQNAASICGADSKPEFNNCLFVGAASTHAFVSDNAAGTFDSCEFESGGTAVFLEKGAKPLFKNCIIHNVDCGVKISDNACGQFKSCDIFDFRIIGVGITGVNQSEFDDCKIHANKHKHDVAMQLYENKGGLVTTSIKTAYKGFSMGFNKIKTNLMGAAKSNEASQPSLDDDDQNNSAVGLLLNNGATGTFAKCAIYGTNGNVVHVDKDCSVSLTDCSIHNGKQNGVFVTNGANVNLQNCTIEDNAQDNILVNSNGVVDCASCNILNAGKIGVHCDASGECKFSQCQVSQNKAMGFSLDNNSMASIDKCVISQNAGFGITVNNGAGGSFTNNELSDNKTLLGGGNWNISPLAGSILRDGNNPNA